MEPLIQDLILIAPLHVANDLLFLVYKYRLLGPLHNYDRIISKELLGPHKNWLGVGVVIACTTLLYFPILGKACLLPGIGLAIGICLNSFVKRRLGIKRGGRFPPFDQLDFFVGGVVGLALYGVFLNNFLLMAVLSAMLHFASNIAAYLVGMKKVWW